MTSLASGVGLDWEQAYVRGLHCYWRGHIYKHWRFYWYTVGAGALYSKSLSANENPGTWHVLDTSLAACW